MDPSEMWSNFCSLTGCSFNYAYNGLVSGCVWLGQYLACNVSCGRVWQSVFIGVATVLSLYIVYLCYLHKKTKSRRYRSAHYGTERQDSIRTQGRKRLWSYTSVRNVLVLLLLVAVVWEFMRLFQLQFAKQAAIAIKGIPEECMPERMTLLGKFWSWFPSVLSWSPDPCVEYHKAVLVNPLWEINPLNVLSSLVTRCVAQIMIALSETMPQALRATFAEMPLVWQIASAAFTAILLLIIAPMLLIVTCRYTVHTPLFRLEPKSPNARRPCLGCAAGGESVIPRDDVTAPLVRRRSLKRLTSGRSLDS